MRVGVLLAALSILSISQPVRAQEPRTQAAEQLFREGREALKRGEAAVACAKFSQSQLLDPAPGTLLNLSECEEALGKLVDAWRHLQEMLGQLPQDDDRVPIARERVASLDRRVPQLLVRLKLDAPKATQIFLDGVGPIDTEVDIPTDPGRHTITAKANGYRDSVTEVLLAESERTTIVVAFAPQPKSPQPPQVAERSKPGPSRLGWIVGGVGVAGLAAAGTLGLILNHKRSIVEDHCDSNRACDPEGLEAAESGRRLSPLYLGAWFVGAAGVAAGASLIWATAPRRSSPSTGTVSVGVGLAGPGLSFRSVF